MKHRILPKIDKEDKKHILGLYKRIRKERGLEELLFFKTLVWACIMAQEENGNFHWLTPRQTFIEPVNMYGDSPLSTIEKIDQAYWMFNNRKHYVYFGKEIHENFGILI